MGEGKDRVFRRGENGRDSPGQDMTETSGQDRVFKSGKNKTG